MRFLLRLVLYGILFILALRVIRTLIKPRSKPVEHEPSKPLRSNIETDRIQDANFTDIKEHSKP